MSRTWSRTSIMRCNPFELLKLNGDARSGDGRLTGACLLSRPVWLRQEGRVLDHHRRYGDHHAVDDDDRYQHDDARYDHDGHDEEVAAHWSCGTGGEDPRRVLSSH